MPLLKRQAFVKTKPPSGLKPDDEVFHCKITNEIFTDYEKFFERTILCNSLVWSCSITGKSSLTYQEAQESEARARKQMASFPEYFEKPILYLASMTHRSRLSDVNDDVFLFCKDRYFANEVVDVLYDNERKVCKVVKVMPPEDKATAADMPDTDSDVICLDSSSDEEDQPLSKMKSEAQKKSEKFGSDPSKYQYVVQEFTEPNIYIVSAGQISRKKGLFTREKCKLYLKIHCSAENHGIWKVKERYLKKFKIHELQFDDFFDGPKPAFVVSKPKNKKKKHSTKSSNGVIDLTEDDEIARAKSERRERKKWEKEEKKRMKKEEKKAKKQEKKQKAKEKEPEKPKMTAEEFAAMREALKQKKLAEKLAKKEELKKKWEEEKQRRKEEREKEREKKKEEKRQREEHLKEWNKPREDMECDDLKDLPLPIPVQSYLPNELFGDVVMLLEYLHCFKSLYELDYFFPYGFKFDDVAKSLAESDIQGIYFDMLKFLLTAIFNLQEEEEVVEDELDDDMKMPEGFGVKKDVSYKQLIKESTIAAQWPQLRFSMPLRNMHLDAFTVTEILRLHLLSSGSKSSDANNKFRYQQRGGYTSFDDAGLEFRRQEPNIIKALNRGNAFDLNPADKLKILTTLVNQLLSYSAGRDSIEEAAEKCRQIRQDLRQLQSAEQKRDQDEKTFWYRKRLEEKAKERELEAQRKEQKKKEREERLKAEESGKKSEGNKVASTMKVEENMEVDGEKEEKKTPRETRSKEKPVEVHIPERKSARQKAKEGQEYDLSDLPVENLNWEKITPLERIRMKDKFLRREKELLDLINQLQHGQAVYPLGKDRCFRRYWMFRSIAGLFVEDQEEHLPEDWLVPVEQKVSETFPVASLPLEQKMKTAGEQEDKSTSSDKENDSFDHSKSDNLGVVSGDEPLAVNAADNREARTTRRTALNKDKEMAGDMVDGPALILQSAHEQIASRNSVRWAFFNTQIQLDRLFEALNVRGHREGQLRQTLQEQKPLLEQSISQCPSNQLCLPEAATAKDGARTVKYQNLKSRNRTTQGAVSNASAKELLELNLREALLDLEERIFIGTLGQIKVANRTAWRDAIENGGYYQQCDEVVWALKTEQHRLQEREREATSASRGMDLDSARSSESAAMDVDQDNQDGEDAGLDQDNQDGEDAGLVGVVYDLARALLQIYQGVEAKYLNPPLGEDAQTKRTKQRAAVEAAFRGLKSVGTPIKEDKKKKSSGDSSDEDSDDEEDEESKKSTPAERWEDGLMSSTSISQVFLHLSVLENSITWDKSALHARCRICRRKGDAEKMLLCDGCDKGHHMYCLKPPMKSVPRGDWYCPDCKPKDLVRTPLKRRKSSLFDDESESEEEDEASEAESSDEETEDEDEASTADESESDEDTEDDTDDSDDYSDEETETEDRQEPPKIKFLRGMRKPASGRSTPSSITSVRSGRSGRETRITRSRHSLETSQPSRNKCKSTTDKTAGTKKASRHSLETTQPKQSKSKQNTRSSAESSTRRTLDSEFERSSRTGSKRRQSSEEPEGGSMKKACLTKSRSSTRVNVMHTCEQLVNELTQREESWPFLKPVTKRDAPDYFDFVKHPMDFSTIKNKINKFEYGKPSQLLADVRLTFKNCQDYNMNTSPEYQAGTKMSKYFEKRCRELKLDTLCADADQSPKKNSSPKKSPSSSKVSPGACAKSTRTTRSRRS